MPPPYTLLEGTSSHETLDVRGFGVSYELRGLGGHDTIYGTDFGDLIIGGLGNDYQSGGAGDDIFRIEGTGQGLDIIHGGAGFDVVVGGAGDDVFDLRQFSGLERIDGGAGTNVLLGSSTSYWDLGGVELVGISLIDLAGGSDNVTLSTGDDRFSGGVGNDTVDGGLGRDTAVYLGSFADYTLTALSGGRVRVVDGSNGEGTDTLTAVEVLEFADGVYEGGVFTPFGDPTNTSPVASDDSYGATEDTPLVVGASSGVIANDSDPDADPLTVDSFDAVSAAGGTVSMNADGSFTYTGASDYAGPDSFDYTVTDGRGGYSTATVDIGVAAVNDAPVAVADAYAGTSDTPLVVGASSGVLSNDTDADGDVLTVDGFDAASVSGGTVSMNADGSFTYTPPAGFTGNDTFAYTVADGNGGTNTQTVSVNVTAPLVYTLLEGTNSHETLDARGLSSAHEIRGLNGHDTIYGTDQGDLIVGGAGNDYQDGGAGDDLFLIEGSGQGLDIIHGGTGFDTILGGAGDDILDIRLFTGIERIDGGAGTNVLLGSSTSYWDLGGVEIVGISLIDLGGGSDNVTLSAGDDRFAGGVGNDTVDGGLGRDTAVYLGNFADYTVTPISGGRLQVSDSVYGEGTDTLTAVEVLEFADGSYEGGVFTPFGDPNNTAPVAADDAYDATEDTPLVVDALSGALANDSDPDLDALTVDSFDAVSAAGGTVAMNPDGSFTYTGAADYVGADSFGYTVSDGRGGFSTATVEIDVAAVNDAPVGADDSYSGTENTVFAVGAAAGVLANDSDADADGLTVDSFDAVSTAGGTVSMNADGSFTYTPAAGFTGADSFAYTVTDGNGAFDTATVTLTVDPAVAYTLLEGTSSHETLDVRGFGVSYELRGLGGHDTIYGTDFGDLIIGGLGNDYQSGGAGDDIFRIEGTGQGLDIVHGGAGFDVVEGGAGDDVFDLRQFSGIERIDGGAGTNVLLGSSTSYWDLGGVELVGISLIDLAGGSDNVTLSTGDDRFSGGVGNDTVDGGLGRDTAVYLGSFADYTLTALSGGRVRVVDGSNGEGTDTLTAVEVLEFADGVYEGGVFTPFGDPTNTSPVASDDSYGATEDTPLVVDASSGVIANDSDPDADPLTVDSFDAVSAAGGTVSMNADGSFTYTGAPDYAGPDSFDYTVTDGRGGYSTATVDIGVAAVNDAPVAVADAYAGTSDTPLVVGASSGVLSNDTGCGRGRADGRRLRCGERGGRHGVDERRRQLHLHAAGRLHRQRYVRLHRRRRKRWNKYSNRESGDLGNAAGNHVRHDHRRARRKRMGEAEHQQFSGCLDARGASRRHRQSQIRNSGLGCRHMGLQPPRLHFHRRRPRELRRERGLPLEFVNARMGTGVVAE